MPRACCPEPALRAPRVVEARAVPEEVLPLLQAYGSGQWLRVIQVGWSGGQDGQGRPLNLFRRMLHEQGFHFVPHRYVYFVRVPEGWSVDILEGRVTAIAEHLNSLRPYDARTSHTERRHGRTRVRARYPIIELSDGPAESAEHAAGRGERAGPAPAAAADVDPDQWHDLDILAQSLRIADA